jgi:hypothetical protein
MIASNFEISRRMITNDREEGGELREPCQVIHALAGALGIWAGIESVVHML